MLHKTGSSCVTPEWVSSCRRAAQAGLRSSNPPFDISFGMGDSEVGSIRTHRIERLSLPHVSTPLASSSVSAQ